MQIWTWGSSPFSSKTNMLKKGVEDASLDPFGALWCVLAGGMRRSKAGGFISITFKSVPPISRYFYGKKKPNNPQSKRNFQPELQKRETFKMMLRRKHLLTKEEMCLRWKGEGKNVREWQLYRQSLGKAGISDFSSPLSLHPHAEASV